MRLSDGDGILIFSSIFTDPFDSLLTNAFCLMKIARIIYRFSVQYSARDDTTYNYSSRYDIPPDH